MLNKKLCKGMTKNASVTTEEETFTKFLIGLEVSKNSPKVLDLL